jgi:hypothetical protein
MNKFFASFCIGLFSLSTFHAVAEAKQKLPASQIKCSPTLDEMDNVLHSNYGGNFLLQDEDDSTMRFCQLLSKVDQKCHYEYGGDLSTDAYYGDDHYCFVTDTKDHLFKNAMILLSAAVNMTSRDMNILIGSGSKLNKTVFNALADEKEMSETVRYSVSKPEYKDVSKEEAEKSGTYVFTTRRMLNLGKLTLESTYTRDYLDHVLRDEKHHPGESWMLILKPTTEIKSSMINPRIVF